MEERSKNALMLGAAGVGALLAARAAVRKWGEYDLRDKVVLITGGSRGLGLVLARELARGGARLAICSRSADDLERARAELVARGAQDMALPCDVMDRKQVNEKFALLRCRCGPVELMSSSDVIL